MAVPVVRSPVHIPLAANYYGKRSGRDSIFQGFRQADSARRRLYTVSISHRSAPADYFGADLHGNLHGKKREGIMMI